MQYSRTMVATMLALVVAVVSTILLTISGAFETPEVEINTQWNVTAQQPISFQVVDVDGDDVREIFVEDETGIHVLEADGTSRFRQTIPAPFASAVMQVDEDAAFEIVNYLPTAEIVILDGTGSEQTRFSVAETLGGAGQMRLAGPQQDEIVLADERTRIAAFSATGERLWQAGPIREQLRALVHLPDDVGGQVVIGSVGGRVAVFDAAGRQLWDTTLDTELRHLSAFSIGETGLVFISGIDGQLNVHAALSGELAWSANLAQAIDEIRPVELDGDPTTVEIALGGRDGGIWRYTADGEQQWGRRVPGGVNELASFTSADFGDILAVGDDTGSVTFFEADGRRFTTIDLGGAVSLLQSNPNLGNDTLLMGNSASLQLWQPSITTRTAFGVPVAGLAILIAFILGIGYIASRLNLVTAEQAERNKRLSILARSEEELLARWRILREKTRDLDDAHQRGAMDAAQYLDKLRGLRDEMALISEALEQRGITPEIKIVQCPNCGAPVDTRHDTCEFCNVALTQYDLRESEPKDKG
ncbi:MAG: PQQ-binding-like beta-propeller repeat protein [Anaerolineales bacterium]